MQAERIRDDVNKQEEKEYNEDVAKAIQTEEHMRHGGSNNVLWLILQSLRWVGMLGQAANVKLDALIKSGGGGGVPCDLTEVKESLARIETAIAAIPHTGSKAGARIIVRGPVENR